MVLISSRSARLIKIERVIGVPSLDTTLQTGVTVLIVLTVT